MTQEQTAKTVQACRELYSGSTVGYVCVMAAFRYGLLSEYEKNQCLNFLDEALKVELTSLNW